MSLAPIIERFFAPLLEGEAQWLEEVRQNVILDSQAKYFDWTASGLAYKVIESRIQEILPFYANTHSFSAKHSRLMSALYEEGKYHLTNALELDEDFLLISCGSGASGAIKKFQEILGLYIPPQTRQRLAINPDSIVLPQVFISSYEHHSIEISLRECLCEIQKIGLDSQGRFCLEDFTKKLQDSTQNAHTDIIATIALASNVSGIVSPFAEIASSFRHYAPNGTLAFDAASSSPHLNVPSHCFDALFLAPHKLLGGVQSCGLLALRKKYCQTNAPSFSGGGTIEYASDKGHLYVEDLTHREEAGTPYILGLLRAALAYKLRNEVGLAQIQRRERVLSQIFLNELRHIPALSLYGDWDNSRDNLGIMSFNIACVSPFELSALLSQKFGIQTRAGCSCAGPYGHYLMELDSLEFHTTSSKQLLYSLLKDPHKRPGWIRVSLHYTHSIEDIEYLIESLHKCVKILRS